MKLTGLGRHTPARWGAVLASPRAPLFAAAALSALLGARLGALTWALLPEPEPAAPPPPAMAFDQTTAADAVDPATQLARLHLFGQPRAPEPDEPVADAPETQLNLTLKGLFVPGDGRGMAIITTGDDGANGIYSAGDTIVGNARVAAVLRDRVVVERDGAREVLLMEGVSNTAPERRRTSRNRAQERRVQAARQWRERFRSEPASLARTVRFRPARRDGELIGYRIRSRSDELSLEELGVRPSDVVTRVNGVPLDDPRRANEALMSLRDARSIELELLRNGRTERLAVPIGAPS